MPMLVALLIGALFGAGLVVSGMSNPANVLNFLDILGTWDARLMFVMGGAVLMTAIGFPLLMRRTRPLLAEKFSWPTANVIDRKLLLGAALFGVGWGLAGYCPGPALVSIGTLAAPMLYFIPALVAGMWLATKLR
jgi:uncharacterized protein